jgi:hypothetical protein
LASLKQIFALDSSDKSTHEFSSEPTRILGESLSFHSTESSANLFNEIGLRPPICLLEPHDQTTNFTKATPTATGQSRPETGRVGIVCDGYFRFDHALGVGGSPL